MSEKIIKILMERDGNTYQEAQERIKEAQERIEEALLAHDEFQEDPFEICYEHFGLEPDYLMDLLY
jgi:hypothetical protein